ncbi:MAG: hypothetical protein R3E61_00735 [Pseudomonadales bacterium]
MTEFQKVVKPTLLLNGKACFARINDVTIMVNDVQKWNNELVLEYLNEMAKVGDGVSVPASVAVYLGDGFDTANESWQQSGLKKKDLNPRNALR